MAMANGARTLAEAYPGRFMLGIGVSHAPSVASTGQRSTSGRSTRMAAYLDAMEAAAYTAPAPAERLPLVLAALGPGCWSLPRPARTAPTRTSCPWSTRRWRGSGWGPSRSSRGAGGGARSRPGSCPRRRRARSPPATSRSRTTRNNLRRLGWSEEDVAGSGSDRLLDAVVVQGDVGAIADRVRQHLDAGADHVCVQLRAPDPGDLSLAGYGELRAALGDLVGEPGPPG